MTKNLLRPFLVLLCFLSINSYALPIFQADAFITGDNKATLEVDTGLIWMDFGVNNDRSYAEVVNSLSTDYLGWRLPSVQEVNHLWTGLFSSLPGWVSYGDSFGMGSSMEHDDYFNQIYDVFGTNLDMTYILNDADGNTYETWLAKSIFGVFETSPQNYGIVSASAPYDAIHRNEALFLASVGSDASSWYGTLLVKDPVTVPEPEGLILLALGFLGLAIRRLRHQR